MCDNYSARLQHKYHGTDDLGYVMVCHLKERTEPAIAGSILNINPNHTLISKILQLTLYKFFLLQNTPYDELLKDTCPEPDIPKIHYWIPPAYYRVNRITQL